MLSPYFEWVTPDVAAKYLPPAAFILVGLWLFWSTRPKPTQPPIKGKPAPLTGVQESNYIRDKDVRVYAGSVTQRQFPRYRMKFIRNGKGGRVLVEFSAFVGNYWTERRTVILRNLDPFVRDQEVSGPLISADDIDSEIWRWGGASFSPLPGGTVTTVASQTDNMQLMRRCFYRGRIVFQDDDDGESQCYFIVTQPEMASSREMPTVIGNQLFDFIAEWEAQDDVLNLV